MGSQDQPLIQYFATPYASGYDFSPWHYPPLTAPYSGSQLTFMSLNDGGDVQFWTFNAQGQPFNLFAEGAAPYTATEKGQMYTIDSHATPGVYYLSSTSVCTFDKKGDLGKGMNGSLNVGSRPL